MIDIVYNNFSKKGFEKTHNKQIVYSLNNKINTGTGKVVFAIIKDIKS